jgi:hypothetical protein
MKPYLTAQKFRTMGFGVETEEHEDPFISALCQRAHALVEAYCLVPRLPVVHDFRGGSVKDEQHTWRYPGTPTDIGQRKLWPFHWPVIQVNDFKIKVTNKQWVSIAPSELFINNTQRYVEVVSLAITSHGLFQALVVPNIGLATPVAEVAYDYGRLFVETDEVLTWVDGKTWRAQHQWWKAASEATPIVVKKDGVDLVVTTDYTIDIDEGTVILEEESTDTNVITASYTHTLPSEIRDAMGYIVASLHAETEHHQRGMAHLNRLSVEEVTMERQRTNVRTAASSKLEEVSPEAALLLGTYRFDGAVIR